MKIIEQLQGLATTTLSTIFSVFEMLGGLSFFVLLFAILYLVCNKKLAFNYFLTYVCGFAVGSLLLKNVCKVARPYDANPNLLSNRDVYSGSMPSAKTILSAESGAFICTASRKKINNAFGKIVLIFVLLLLTVGVGVSQMYFANNYLLDCIIGLVIGGVISAVILALFSKIKIKKGFMLLLVIPFVALLFVYVKQWFTPNFKNLAVFEFVGISVSILLGTFIEEKCIKFNETKNNIFNTTFKLLTIIIVLLTYNFLYNEIYKILPSFVIFGFVKYFLAGIIVTIILPMFFKKLEKYFYIFSTSVNKNNVVMSEISLSVKGTKRIARKILNTLKKGDVVLLSGDLGAGKTELVRGILKLAGVKKEITSPTFTIVNEYSTKSGHYYHFDMYRIQDEQEVVNIDFVELVDKKDAIKFIEWPEKVTNFLPQSFYKITIEKLGKSCRNIILENYTTQDITENSPKQNVVENTAKQNLA